MAASLKATSRGTLLAANNPEGVVLSLHEDGAQSLEEAQCEHVESMVITQHRHPRKLHSDPKLPRVPVFYLTTRTPSVSREEGTEPEPEATGAPMPWEVNPRRIKDLVPAPATEPDASGEPSPKMMYAEWRALGIRSYGDWEAALRKLAPAAGRRLAVGVRMPRSTMVAASSPFIKQCVEFARALEQRGLGTHVLHPCRALR